MSSGSRASVLILDGHSLASLAFTRSLGRAGVTVSVGAATRLAPAGFSRFCSEFVVYPSPMDEPESFRQWLFGFLARRQFDLLVGTTDQTVPLLDEWREQLAHFVRVPLSSSEAFRLAWDKAATLKLASQVGLTIPPTDFIQSWEELEQVARDRPPFVIKTRNSVGFFEGRRLRLSVEYAFDAETLRRKYAELHGRSAWPMVQRYVPGDGVGCLFLIWKGRTLARFQHRRIRDLNPTGSGSCLRVSIPLDVRLVEMSERLLRAINWEGLAMVEYRVAADGAACLMEINPRPWGSMHLALAAGVDFPLLWYRAVCGEPVEPVSSYRVGIRCRYLAGDFQHLESVLHGPPAGWPLEYPKRLPTILQFLNVWSPHLYYDEFVAGDWRPGFVELRGYFGDLARRFARWLFSRSKHKAPGGSEGHRSGEAAACAADSTPPACEPTKPKAATPLGRVG